MTSLASTRLAQLKRTDKWVLSNAGRLIFAPTHPRYLHRPGLWDEAHFYNHPIRALGTISLVDTEGYELELFHRSSDWQPDRWIRMFSDETGSVTLLETAIATENDHISLRWDINDNTKNMADGPSLLKRFSRAVFWTTLGSSPARSKEHPSDHVLIHAAEKHIHGFRMEFESAFETLKQPALRLTADWTVRHEGAFSTHIVSSQGGFPEPVFNQTPFFDSFPDGFSREKDGPVLADGMVYAGCLFELSHPFSSIEMRVGFQCAEVGDASLTGLEADWASFFENCPSFQSSSPWFSAYFDYRLFGLRMNTLPGGSPCIPYPAVCEGPGYFRAPITYSAQCHLLETRWFASALVAQGSILNFIANQQPDGRFIGYLGPKSLPGEFFYHANWGRILELDAIHPDPAFLKHCYTSLVKYVAFFDAKRDAEGSGLYDIENHYETGQEYMHRYVAIHSSADEKHWGSVFRLKGVDVSTYLYQIKQALALVALQLGDREAHAWWKSEAKRTGDAILTEMWDPMESMFFDSDPSTSKRTGVKAAVCFYPYLTDLVDESHIPGLKRHLFNPDEFWTQFPVPSSAVDDIFYNPDGRWKGERKNCPWNGRVWPMTNSHVAELLATTAIRFNDQYLKEKTVDFITKYIEMMFFEGNQDRPNSFEHYHPENGKPSIFRGVDDYQHSWILDLIVQYVCGVRPHGDLLTIDPFPFDLDHFELKGIRIRGYQLHVARTGSTFSVHLNDETPITSRVGQPVIINL